MKLIVFDLDGTLLDTLDNITASVNNAMDTLSLPRHSKQAVKEFIGKGADVLMERALPDDKRHLKKLALTLHKEFYDERVCENTVEFKGISDLLKNLKKKGHILAVYSNKGEQATQKVVEHFFPNVFDEIRGTTDYSIKKPNPKILNEIIDKFKIPKNDVVYVGDSVVDVEVSINAGVPCVSVLWGYQDKKLLKDNGSIYFAKSPKDVFSFVQKGKLAVVAKDAKYKKLHQKIGLALSGGGARGIAHIGVIKAFEEENVKFDFVSGTSAGSFVACAYCAGFSVEEMTAFSKTLRGRDLINTFFKIRNDSSNIERTAKRLFGDLTFDDLKIPCVAVAVDLVKGEEVELNQGSVAKAISASCAAPIIFTAVQHENKQLVDGGLLNNMPADVVRRMGADFVVSVDLDFARGQGTPNDSLLNSALATWRIVMKSSVLKGQMNSDVIIYPNLSAFKSTELGDVDELIQQGYLATKEKMNEIKEFLNIK